MDAEFVSEFLLKTSLKRQVADFRRCGYTEFVTSSGVITRDFFNKFSLSEPGLNGPGSVVLVNLIRFVPSVIERFVLYETGMKSGRYCDWIGAINPEKCRISFPSANTMGGFGRRNLSKKTGSASGFTRGILVS